MLISAIAPFVFLSKYGRNKIGIKKATKSKCLGIAFIIGTLFSVVLYFLGDLFYGNPTENWYSYIGKSYNIPEVIDAHIAGDEHYFMVVDFNSAFLPGVIM